MNQHFNYHSGHYPYISYRQQPTTAPNPSQPAQQQPGSNVILPKVNTELFVISSREVRDLLTDAVSISDQLIKTDVGREIQEAAQKNDTATIYRLLGAIGMKSNIHVSYTPHSIIITVTPPNQTSSLQTTVTLQMVWNAAF